MLDSKRLHYLQQYARKAARPPYSPPPKKYKHTIVLDVDKLLLSKVEQKKWQKKLLECDLLRVAHHIDLVLFSFIPYIINPGATELIKLLLQQEDTEVVFFSSTMPELNEVRIRKLLIKIFGEDVYRQKYAAIRIFSGHHTKESSKIPDVNPINIGNLKLCGQMKKDLTVITEDLANTAIVDDDVSYAVEDQIASWVPTKAIDVDSLELAQDSFQDRIGTFRFDTINSLFHSTGMLFTALEKSVAENISLSAALFALQYQFNPDENAYFFVEASLQEYGRTLYDKGLKLLQRINPNLSLNDENQFLGFNEWPAIDLLKPFDMSALEAEHLADMEESVSIFLIDLCHNYNLSLEIICTKMQSFENIYSFLSKIYWQGNLLLGSHLNSALNKRVEHLRCFDDYGLNNVSIKELTQALSTLDCFSLKKQSVVPFSFVANSKASQQQAVFVESTSPDLTM